MATVADLEIKLKKLLDDKFDTFEVLSECRKIKIDIDFSFDMICQKHLLQRGLVVEILKNHLEDSVKKTYYEKLLQSTENFLKWKTEKSKGFPCSVAGCLFRGKRHRNYLQHLKTVHPSLNMYSCKYRLLCKRNFLSVKDLENHVERDHDSSTNRSSTAQEASKSINEDCKCAMLSCGQRRFHSIRELTSHINVAHAQEPRPCIFENCDISFGPGKISRHHFRLKHFQVNSLNLKMENRVIVAGVNIVDNEEINQFDSYEPPFDLDQSIYDIFEESNRGDEANDDEGMPDEEAEVYFKMAYCDFLNQLTSFKFIPLSSVKSIAQEYISIAKKSALEKEKILLRSLRSCPNLAPVEVEKVVDDISQTDFFLKAQEDLISEHRRSKFFAENFNLVKPVEIVLNPNEVKMGLPKDCIHYIPIKDSLKVLVEDKTYIAVKESSQNKNMNSALEDIKDGSSFKSNDFFIKNPEAATILMYSDAVELTNPLGSGRLKHKIVQVFWSLCDIPRHHRSQIDKLQLGLVFREKLLKKYSLKQIFKQLVDDLKDLEDEGIAVQNPREMILKAGVLAYAADNLEV